MEELADALVTPDHGGLWPVLKFRVAPEVKEGTADGARRPRLLIRVVGLGRVEESSYLLPDGATPDLGRVPHECSLVRPWQAACRIRRNAKAVDQLESGMADTGGDLAMPRAANSSRVSGRGRL